MNWPPPDSQDNANILDIVPEAYVLLDSEFRPTFLNQAAERLLWKGRDDSLGRAIWEVYPAVFGTPFEKRYRRAMAERTPLEFEDYYAPWQRWYAITVTPGPGGGIAVHLADITDRKRTEERLRESEERFRALFEGAPLGFQSLDEGGRCIEVNQAWLDTLGYSREEVIGKWFGAFLAPEFVSEFRERYARFKAAGKLHFEFQMLHKNGERRFITFEGRVGYNADGSFRKTYCILQDTTECKQAQEALRLAREAAEADTRAKSEFLSSMSHEIRTPMCGVIGMTGLLLNTPLTPEQQGYMEVVRSSCEALLGIINNILDFSKLEAGKLDLVLVPFDLHDVLDDVVKLLAVEARKKCLELHFRYAPEAPREFLGDPGRIRQVALNLVGNAIKFTERGHVLVEVGSGAISEGVASIRIAVHDTGIGIPADRQGMLFQKFQQLDSSTTRKHGGTGLGLAISKQLVELMGGTLSLVSQVGGGSTFSIEMPLRTNPLPRAEPREGPGEEPTAHASFAGRRVLLVEDNIVNQKVGVAMLGKLGCRVEVAANGREALSMTSQSYDLIFMDCQLPEMDGYQTTGEIRKREGVARHTPIVALTAGAMAEDRERCLQAGMDDYVSKPFEAVQLYEMLDKYLSNPVHSDRRQALGGPD